MKNYTIGEVFRLGLLKNHKGEPYRQKATVSRVIRMHMKAKTRKTPFGSGYVISEADIREVQRRLHT